MARSAMIECPTCERNVARSAMACPSCGAVLRRPRRSVFGYLVLAAFWVFNGFMVLWFLELGGMAEDTAGTTGAERAGEVIGLGIGFGLLIFVWIAGACILGLMALLTRPRGG